MLLVLVLVIWGWICYRLFFSGVEPDIPSTAGTPVRTGPISRPAPAVDLGLAYPDPFLKTREATTVEDSYAAEYTGDGYYPEYEMPPDYIDWSFIRFTGLVSRSDAGRKVALLRINGQDIMLRERQSHAGVQLLRSEGDQVTVSYQGQTQTIRLSNEERYHEQNMDSMGMPYMPGNELY